MRIRSLAARLAASALLVLAATAAGALPAQAAQAAGPPSPYALTLSSDPGATDFDHRTVGLTGVLTRSADGTPVADATVNVGQSVLYRTWNPWGDPIDPVEREERALGTFHTDANGRFTVPDIQADRWQQTPSIFLTPLHEVEFWASYDPPDDPTDHDLVYTDTDVYAQPVTSTITAWVNQTKVRKGSTLIVKGKVNWPAGHGPVEGTRVLLRTYFEGEYRAQTTADTKGNFTVSAKIRDYDNEFVVFSAPKDYYVAGATKNLPVQNVTP